MFEVALSRTQNWDRLGKTAETGKQGGRWVTEVEAFADPETF